MTWLFVLFPDKFEVFPRFLAIGEVEFWYINAWDKQTRETEYNFK